MTDRPDPELRIDRSAPVRHIELDASSWVDVAAGFVPDAVAARETIQDATAWEQTEVLRYDHYYAEQRLGAVLDPERDPLLRQTGMHLRSRYRHQFTGVGALLYRSGADFQGLHSDREMRWLDDTLIAIVVLGARRPFVFRQRRPIAEVTEKPRAGSLPDDVVLTPGEGDLLVMGGACQRDWLHGVPAADTDRSRISLTWRWTSRRGRPDTNPTYYDGRQYGDRPQQPGSRIRPR